MRISALIAIIIYYFSSSSVCKDTSTVLLSLEDKSHYLGKIRNVVTNQGKPRGRRQDNIGKDNDDDAYTYNEYTSIEHTDEYTYGGVYSDEYYPSGEKPVVTGILPRQTNIKDLGYKNCGEGWYDVQGQGVKNDYCRWVGDCGEGQFTEGILPRQTNIKDLGYKNCGE